MRTRYLTLSAVLAMTIVVAVPMRLLAFQSPAANAPLTLEGVVALAKTGMPEDAIITRIKKNGKPFDLSKEELLDLRKQGVTDMVIKFLLDPSQPYTPAAAPTKHYPDDSQALKVPPEPGLYCSGDVLMPIEISMLLGRTDGGRLKKKGSTIAYLVGSGAKSRIKEVSPVFYLRLPEGKAIEEIVLVAFEVKNDRRELNMGSHQQEELNPNMVKRFDAVEVGARLFRINPGDLGTGEYLFFMTNSAEPAKGNYGKGYDFGIEGARH